MKKKKIEWLEMLNEPERSRALENYDKNYTIYYFSDTLADALINSFDWMETPEGDDYWRVIYDKLERDVYVFEDTYEKKMSDWLDKIEKKHKGLEEKLDAVIEKMQFGNVPVGKVKDKRSDIDKIWDDIEENFDWDRLWVAMDAVGWKWVLAEDRGVPRISELKKEAKRLVYTAYEKHTFIATGGFEAEYSEEYGTVALQFVFGQWEGVVSDE
jgi:hypothetical protein